MNVGRAGALEGWGVGMDKDWACAPRAGWDEYERARARYLARLAEQALLVRLEQAWAAPAAQPPSPAPGAGGGGRP
ncbi:MAG: hypothetical protein QOK40_3602 [Miltoncostaeaceae bacterium]|jgi:hypothetical protein|nr:hypothetical protein [Miltoncostaeaceae bacterium]